MADTAPTTAADVIALARSLLGMGLAEIRGNYALEQPWHSYPDADWCAWFVSWLLRGNGTGYATYVYQMANFGPQVSSPQVGDIVCFGPDVVDDYHTGLISNVTSSTVYVIDGNGGTAGPMDTVVQERPIWSPCQFIRPSYQPGGPIGPSLAVRNNNGMSSLFHIQNTDGSNTWALAGDGVGTAAWLQIVDVNVANSLALQHGNAVDLDWDSWQAWKAAYTSAAPVHSS